MVNTHLWNSIGISPSGSTIIACCKNNANTYDIYSSINNTNIFNICYSGITIPVNIISVIDISYVLFSTNTDLYISKDNGISFSKVFGNNNNNPITSPSIWTGVSISSDTGQYMVACIGGNPGGGIYLSSDYGSTWGLVLSVNQNFTSISISETGQYIVACFSGKGGGIYTSEDSGNSWSNNPTIPINLNWSSICIKEKYSFAVVCDTSGYIYTSTSNGNIWVDASLNLPITTNFKKVCISDYGYAIALSNFNIWVTANYGENWNTKSAYNGNVSTIKDIGVSTNGLLVMCDISNIYTSSIYSIYNNPKIYYSTDVSFVTKGLLNEQVYFSSVLNTSFYVNFQNPVIFPNNYNIVVQNSSDLTDPSKNMVVLTTTTNNNYSIFVYGLKENIGYNMYLQSIYPNVTSVIYKQQYTKGSPINVSVNVTFITDVSMNISFINCPYIPENYSIYIVNQGSSVDSQTILLSKEYVEQHLIMYLGKPLIPYTIHGLSQDSKYQLSITSIYEDISYTSIPITDILTKSAPSNISYTLNTGNTVDITYSPPSYVIPPTITLFLYNIDNNTQEQTFKQSSVYQKYIFTNLKVNATYNIILQSDYENMTIKSSPITFTNLGKPIIVCSYRFDTYPEIQKYIITTNIYLASKPTYLINFKYPPAYEALYGISNETFDIPTNTTNHNLYNIDVLGEYTITVYAIFDATTTISSIPFVLTLKQRPIIQFGNIDISYTYINIPYTIYEYAISPPQYKLYLKNSLYPLIYDQSYNIPNIVSNTTCSYTTQFNILAGTSTYSIYITDGIFYSDYINKTVPEVVTVSIDYSKTNKSDSNRLTIYYTVLQRVLDSSYTLFVNGNATYPTIYFSSSTRDPSINELSVDVTIIGTMNYYIVNYFPDGSIYRTPSGTQNFDSKTTITFGFVDISYNYFVVPTTISTFAFKPRYSISISGNFFTNAWSINPSTIVSNNNSRFNVYANTGTYFIQLTDGVTYYIPDPSFITLPTSTNTLSDISYTFITATNVDNTNTNKLSVSYSILNTLDPSYTLYLKNSNYNDLSFSIKDSTTFFTPENFVPTKKNIIELTNIITRSGNYSFYIKHNYNGVLNNKISPFTYISPSTDIVIDISNIVVLSYVSNSFTAEINIQSNITTFDIIPLTYKVYLQSVSFTRDLSYSYNITIPTSTNYTSKYTVSYTTDFSNIYVNTGNYIYYIVDSSGRKYSADVYNLTLPSQSNTFGFIGDLSSNNANNNGKISTLYGISYESYKPTYSIFVTNTTIPSVTDCSYSSSIYMDNSSTIIKRSKNINYSIDVSNIYRTGIYSVYLQNNYNGTSSTSSNYIETTITKQIYLYLPNNVSYGTIIKDISSVNIPFTITAYDISDVLYNVTITNNTVSSTDISYSTSFTLANNHKYYAANISNNTIYFRNLFANSGTYSYKVFNNNGVVYPGSTFTLPSISTTFSLRDLTANYFSSTNDSSGSITARYDISYITYSSIFKAFAVHTQLNDCSFTNSMVGIQTYSAISNPHSLTIRDIYRSGTYTIYLKNLYNNLANIETTNSKTVDLYLPNYITYTNVTSDCSSITIPLTVTSHDLSFVSYTIYLKTNDSGYINDLSYSQTFIVWNNNRNYSAATIYTSTFLFKNLYANSGTYDYSIIGNTEYPSYIGSIFIPNVTTITLRSLSSTMFNTYSLDNSGSITARYDISYVSYKPNYQLKIIHSALSACSYNTTVTSANIPSQNSNISNSYYVSYSPIYRTGIYHVYIENEYTQTGSNYVDKTSTIDISVNLPNDISYTSVSRDISSINMSIKNICFDISNAYTVTVMNDSITTDISYSNGFSVVDNNTYNAPITTLKSFVFTNLFINTGNYYYYITDWYGNRYPSINSASNLITLPTKQNTITLKDVSSTIFNTYSTTNNGSITVKYDISYISYKPTYTLQVVSKTFTDCSYTYSISGSIIPSDYTKIQNTYLLSISNIFRTSMYSVYLKNSYNNGLGSEQYTRDISVNLPNDVSYQIVTADTTSIAIKFEITSFDISATKYTLYIKNTTLDLSANQTFTVPYSNSYSTKNTLNVQDFSFQNLFANTGRYYYYFTNSNGINYPSITTLNSIELLSLGKTIQLVGVTSTMYTVYSVTNIGGISGEYQIIVKSNNPTYTLIATNKALNDCSYSAAITPLTVTTDTSYYLNISPIYRTGIYSVILQNKYTGGTIPEYSNSIDITVNLPNDVSFQTVTSTINTITIPYKITSFDISNVIYTAYVKDISFDTLVYSQEYTLTNSTNYNAVTTSSNMSFIFTNLLANTGNYYYYITNSNGIRYPAIDNISNKISLVPVTNTIVLNSVSMTTTATYGSITANYNISYLTHIPTYKIIATNIGTTVTDCSYIATITSTSIPSTYPISNPYTNLSISNIKRSGNYRVIMQNIYNGGNVETASATKNILVNIPNEVTTSGVVADFSSITIPVTITSYDISNVTYTVTIQDISFSSLTSNQTYTLINSTNYTQANTLNRTFLFPNLLANTGNYNYSITSNNGFSLTNTISLQPVSNTIVLKSVSSTKTDVSGSITANYSISYLTYNPTYKVIATNVGTTVTDCSYTISITGATDIPITYAAIASSYNLSISNIKRSGNYRVIMQNIYNGGNVETASDTKYTSINITNDVSYGIGITSDISYIAIPVTITSYDISNVGYTMWVKDVSFTDVSYSQTYTLNNTSTYNSANSYSGTFFFPNLLANTGKYNYYITSTNGLSYTQKTLSLPPITNTIALNSVSAANSDVSGSISANYSISYLTYNPTYKVIATNNTIGTSDCSYAVTVSNVPTTYASIASSYNLSISNIKRSGNYSVVLQNTYNNGRNVETATRNISINIMNDVSYGTGVTADISSITIPVTITSYDISNVSYTVYIKDISFTDLSYNQSFTLNNSTNNYTVANTYSGTFIFTNLLVNTGKYYYYITNTNGLRYPTIDGATNIISLTPVARTITLKEVSANILSTYSATNSGRITAKYDISYVSYAPKYKITAQHTYISATDCSYTNSTITGLPSSYTNRINPYSIDISNIYRSGTYRVYLQNISGSIEQTNTLDISVNLPNDVSFIKVTDNRYSIDISFQITTYDISLVNYKLYIQNATYSDASASITYPIYPTRDYTRATTTNIYHSVFTGLTVSGNYNYYMIDGCNNRYDGSSIYLTGNGL